MTLLITFVIGQLFMFIITGSLLYINSKQMREMRDTWIKEMGEIKSFFRIENIESIRLKK